jgi:hypothetical protein
MPVRLRPGDSAQHAASWDYGAIPNWFRYGSFSCPGTYGIALDLQIDANHNPLASARTPAVALTRIEPVGIDAELWKRMQEISGGRWTDNSFETTKEGVALADEIIQIHSTSSYYPHVVAFRVFRWQEKSKILLEAAQRFPNSPAYPYLLSAAADCARAHGLTAQHQGHVAEAMKYYTIAETQYRAALATKSVAIRKSSELGLLDVTSGME